MSADPITITPADLTDDISRRLVAALNDELLGVYPEAGATHFELDPAEVTGGRGVFLVVYHGGTPVGCGALRVLDGDENGDGVVTAELKRMYVTPLARGAGLGRRLVAALEAEARRLGVR